jgi:hypothetical protein
MNPSDDEPADLLKDEAQWTQPWGGSEDGEPCDKCEGAGHAPHECWSCLLTGADSSCPVCAGKVRWEDECPVCRGSGEIDGSPRHGVSVFPTAEGLYHYMLSTEADLDECLVVEVEGEPSEDVDFDADQGALLILPTEICRCGGIDPELADRVRRRVAELVD